MRLQCHPPDHSPTTASCHLCRQLDIRLSRNHRLAPHPSDAMLRYQFPFPLALAQVFKLACLFCSSFWLLPFPISRRVCRLSRPWSCAARRQHVYNDSVKNVPTWAARPTSSSPPRKESSPSKTSQTFMATISRSTSRSSRSSTACATKTAKKANTLSSRANPTSVSTQSTREMKASGKQLCCSACPKLPSKSERLMPGAHFPNFSTRCPLSPTPSLDWEPCRGNKLCSGTLMDDTFL
ncbi:hypothetical protein IWX50DRAFT_301071 [Phyllosticta citricarpa]